MATETVATAAAEAISTTGMIALSAALSIGISAIATGWAQKAVLPAAVGAIAEDEKVFSKALIFAVLPETILIFGFVIAFLITRLG